MGSISMLYCRKLLIFWQEAFPQTVFSCSMHVMRSKLFSACSRGLAARLHKHSRHTSHLRASLEMTIVSHLWTSACLYSESQCLLKTLESIGFGR
jgi:hypothetical protein